MPNYVAHRVRIEGSNEDIVKLTERVLKPEKDWNGENITAFDFNGLVQMPKPLEGMEKSNVVEMGLAVLGYEGQTLAKMRQGDFSANPVKVGRTRALSYYLEMPWAAEKGIRSVDDMAEYLKKTHPTAVEKAEQALRNFREFGHMDWYDWSVENWGTKWNSVRYAEISRREGYWEFTFETAWSFVHPIFLRISQEFPELCVTVSYIDEGWGFAGTSTYVEGTCVSATEQEYDKEDESYMRQMHEEVYGEPPEEDEEDYDDPWASDGTDRFALILGPGERLPN